MEERIIDEEYGRGIKLKKTQDGYVDVTDAATDVEMEEGEEVSFEFPVFDTDEDDEDLVGLSPEEAMKLRQQKEEEARARLEEYERLCDEGEQLLDTGSFKAAELKYERAMGLDEKATRATVGYWCAKTSNFEDADVLAEEYADEGVENLEFDLGYEAVVEIKEKYKATLQTRYDEICQEEKELLERVEEGQNRRRGVLQENRKKTAIIFAVSAAVAVVTLVLAIYFGLMNFRVSDTRYMVPTIIFVALFGVAFIGFGFCTNKFVNACRIYRENERLSSTEEGARVERLREYKEVYEYLLA